MLRCFFNEGKFTLRRAWVLVFCTLLFLTGCNYLATQPMYFVEAYYEEPDEEYGLQDEEYVNTYLYDEDIYYTANDATEYSDYSESPEQVAPEQNLQEEEPSTTEYISEPIGNKPYTAQTAYSLEYALVIRVIDGDTIVLDCGERVRFIGIDTPEIGEPGSGEATQFVAERVYGRTVWLEADGNDRDSFGRLRRYVWLSYPADTQNEVLIVTYQINALLLIYGLADVLIVGTPRNEALFRSIAGTSIHEPVHVPQEDPRFIGNRNSLVFHIPTCTTLPAPHNRIYFATRDDAISAGHRPCGRCNP